MDDTQNQNPTPTGMPPAEPMTSSDVLPVEPTTPSETPVTETPSGMPPADTTQTA